MAETRSYWLHALTPLHVGAGRGVGYIDLPIMREKVTHWPLVPGSAVKGVMRDHHEGKKTEGLDAAFGRGGEEHSNSGSLVLTDARLVCLPVRSFYGTFAWCSSALALQRLARDLQTVRTAHPSAPSVGPVDKKAWIPEGAPTKLKDVENKIFLEDLDFDADNSGDAKSWADFLAGHVFDGEETWQNTFRQRFVILPDDVFNFLCETGTEVNARVRILEDKKTVAPGALWYEEALPAESILSGLVWCDRVFGGNGIQSAELMDRFCSNADLQVGGKATVGYGRVRCLFTNGGQAS